MSNGVKKLQSPTWKPTTLKCALKVVGSSNALMSDTLEAEAPTLNYGKMFQMLSGSAFGLIVLEVAYEANR